jgi:hypothetical protein
MEPIYLSKINNMDLSNNMDDNNIKRKRIVRNMKDINTIIPTYKEYDLLKTNKYTVSELKDICRYYKIPLSGKNIGSKKADLIERCYNYLYYYEYATIINKTIRGFLQRRYFNIKGKILYKRETCVNDCDFLTLEKLNDIPHYQFFSFKQGNHYYGFDILSFRNLVNNNKDNMILNPYNREKITEDVINIMRKTIKYSLFMNFPIELDIEKDNEELTKEELLKRRIYKIFQKMDELGNYTDDRWVLDLDHFRLIRFIRELHEIWNYRIFIPIETKVKICNPTGNPFYGINLNQIRSSNSYKLLESVVTIMENFIFKSIDDNNSSLGAMYILTALTLVNSRCAEALPWLYETAIY